MVQFHARQYKRVAHVQVVEARMYDTETVDFNSFQFIDVMGY